MSQGMVLQRSSIIWAQNNGYEQVWHSVHTVLHSRSSATLSEQAQKQAALLKRAELCQLSRLPRLLHDLSDIICTSTHHTAGKLEFWKIFWSCSRGRSSLANGICILKVAAPSIHAAFPIWWLKHPAWDKIYGVCKHMYKNQCLELALITFSTCCLECENLQM